MPVRVPLVVLIAHALLLPLGLTVPLLAAEERLDAAAPGGTAPAALAQAPTAPPTESPAPAAPQVPPAQSESAAAPSQAATPPPAGPEPSGLAWTRSFTGRQIPDATGTRFYRPATSGGTGVIGW
jgi:hypothetical protein